MKRSVVIAFLTWAFGAGFAEAPDPALQHPRAGSPALVAPGETFRVVLREAVETDAAPPTLAIEDGQGRVYPLRVNVEGPWQSGTWCTAQVDAGTPEGRYAIVLGKGAESARYPAAVWVGPQTRDYYVVAQVREPVILNTGEFLPEAFQEARDAGSTFALMTGPFTRSGKPEDLAAIYARVVDAPLPVVVVGSETDDKAGHLADYFSTAPWAFRYGDDGFLVIPTADRPLYDVAWPQDGSRYDGLIAYWRNALIGARWVVVVIPAYRTGQWLRLDQTLLADDPVVAVMTGPLRDGPPGLRPSPWGDTLIVHAPDQAQGKVRIVDITAQGPRPRALAGDKPKEDAPTTE